MTPAARLAAAIDVLDVILTAGQVAERALTNWARSNRYAGSKDRAAVRDVVYDCLRCRDSYAHAAGMFTARGIMSGRMLVRGEDIDACFTGEGYAPSRLEEAERGVVFGQKPPANTPQALDFPAWLEPELKRSLGGDLAPTMTVLRDRAPVDLRVNLAKTTVPVAQVALTADGIPCEPVDGVETALRLVQPSRKIINCDLYKSGHVELQDAGSQALVLDLPIEGATRALDYCAGGGGKSLALAARAPQVQIDAYDISSARMQDLTVRAERAGAKINVLATDPVTGDQKYDLVYLDVPCSGSGAWRRSPDAKWRFKAETLQSLVETQRQILQACHPLVAEGGHLVYLTCSILQAENQDQIAGFIQNNPEWNIVQNKHHRLLDGTDGFYSCCLRRK